MNRMKFLRGRQRIYIKITQTHRVINAAMTTRTRPMTRREALAFAGVAGLWRDSRRS